MQNVLWALANRLIPGGNSLFSKTPMRYAPDSWPAYYDTAKGITVTDLQGNTYKDFSVLGAGNSVLGYNDPDVQAAVLNAINRGNVSTLNPAEEVYLSQELLELFPKFDMVRMGRSGNDACQIALRIAREYSKSREFAICGYHGWQIGHPPQLDLECLPFEYGDLEGFYKSLSDGARVVMMECVRNKPIDLEFLKEIREVTISRDIPLIFDEVASGFRINLGGVHQTVNVIPDLCTVGKAIGNGYAVSAVLGKQEFMEKAKNTFISSMFWSERLGFAAGLATIDKMKQTDAQIQMVKKGQQVKQNWMYAAECSGLDIEVSSMDPLAHFDFVGDEDRVKITTFTQEMLKKGFLASGQFYASICHTNEDIQEYSDAVEDTFIDIAEGNVKLEGRPAVPGFVRLA